MSDRICRRYINKEWKRKVNKSKQLFKRKERHNTICDIIMLKQCLWLPYCSNWNGVFVPLMSSKWNIVAIRCTQIITLLLKILVILYYEYVLLLVLIRVDLKNSLSCSGKTRHAEKKMDKTFTNISQIFTENVKQWCSHLADILSSNSKIWLQS